MVWAAVRRVAIALARTGKLDVLVYWAGHLAEVQLRYHKRVFLAHSSNDLLIGNHLGHVRFVHAVDTVVWID